MRLYYPSVYGSGYERYESDEMKWQEHRLFDPQRVCLYSPGQRMNFVAKTPQQQQVRSSLQVLYVQLTSIKYKVLYGCVQMTSSLLRAYECPLSIYAQPSNQYLTYVALTQKDR